MQQPSWPAPPGVPSNGVIEARSGPYRWINVALAAVGLLAVAIVVVEVATWSSSEQDDPEVRAIVGLASAVLVLFGIVVAIVQVVALGLLLGRSRAGFVLQLVAAVLAAVPFGLGVPLRWWWPALVAPFAFVAAAAALASDELR